MPASPLWLMVMYVGLGLLQVAISAPLVNRQVKRNLWYGVRLKKTLRDDETWYAANEYGGRQLLWAGLISAVLVFVAYWAPPLHSNLVLYAPVCLGIYVVPLAVALANTMGYVGQL